MAWPNQWSPGQDSQATTRADRGVRGARRFQTQKTCPSCTSTGTVHFRSYQQFLAQYDVNLSNGAIIAHGRAPPLGTRQTLRLVIPGSAPIDLPTVEVVFAADGKVGFTVADPEAFRGALEDRRAPDSRAGGAAATRPPTVVKRTFKHTGQLSAAMPSARAFIDLRKGEASDLNLAQGWYVALVDRVLRSGRDALLKLDNGSDRLKIWIVEGRVVGVERFPPPDKDRLGERLLANRTVDLTALNAALRDAQSTKRPLGQVILSSGSVTRADLHRALRKQIVDRLLVPVDWEAGGAIEVGGWSDPPVNADLLPVTGDAVVTTLLKKQLQRTRLAALKEELMPLMTRPATVDLSRISESYRLSQHEQRYYQRAAEVTGSLATVVSLVNARPLESFRLVLLGAALGFVTFGPGR